MIEPSGLHYNTNMTADSSMASTYMYSHKPFIAGMTGEGFSLGASLMQATTSA